LTTEFHCPAYLENDANAGAMAEHRFGAGKGARNLVFLTLGTGLGAGIILNNHVYSGSNGMAGEIGHVRLTDDGPVGYHKKGSAEGWTSGGGMAQVAAQTVAAARKKGEASSLLHLPNGHDITAKDVGLAAVTGDALACRIVTICGEKLGHTLAILVDILNPERIVIGGLAMRLGDLLLDPARRILAKEALEPSLSICTIMPAALDESIGDTAALCVAMQAAEYFTAKAEE
jgi:glucokinase